MIIQYIEHFLPLFKIFQSSLNPTVYFNLLPRRIFSKVLFSYEEAGSPPATWFSWSPSTGPLNESSLDHSFLWTCSRVEGVHISVINQCHISERNVKAKYFSACKKRIIRAGTPVQNHYNTIGNTVRQLPISFQVCIETQTLGVYECMLWADGCLLVLQVCAVKPDHGL